MSYLEGTGPQPVEVDGEMKLYGDGMTVQSFQDETDINKILKKAQRGMSLSHLQKHGALYGDFTDIDSLMAAHEKLARGKEIFDDLPSEVRREFANDASAFFKYVNDPDNRGRLQELLPVLAEPGQVLPAVRRSAASEANPALASASPEASSPAPGEPDSSGVASSST